MLPLPKTFPLHFEKVSSKKVSDFILDQLEEAIILKDLMSEEQLPTERELAEIFDASRLAVREALAQLEAKGLIEKRVGAKGGTFVLPITMNSHRRTREEIKRNWGTMLKIFEFRSVIEPEAAYLAAQRISAEELARLEDYLLQGKDEDCPRELFRALDVKLHMAIAKASGNEHFEKSVRLIRTRINPALDLMPYDREIRKINNETHTLLYEAIRARDAERSRELMRKHIGKSAEAIYARVFGENG